MVQAVLFDVEGVLADTHAMHHNALNEALKPHGLEISLEELASRFAGLTTQQKLDILSAERGLSPIMHHEINECKQHLTAFMVPQSIEPSPNLQALILTLRTYGLKIAACSNSHQKTIVAVLNALGIAPWVDVVVGNDSGVRPKPEPDIYLEAAKRLGVEIEECLIVENSGVGLEAALAAGCFRLLKAKDTESVKLDLFKPYLSSEPQLRAA